MKYIFILLVFISEDCNAGFIAWGSTNSIVKPAIRENFLSGFQLGLEAELGEGAFAKYIKTYSDESGLKTRAIDVANQAIKENAIALVGFPGSHDAMLAAGIAKKNSIIAISPGCNHQGLADFGSTVFTTGHSGQVEISSSVWFLEKHFKGKGLIIVNPKAAPSANMGRLFKEALNRGAFKKTKIDITELDNNNELFQDILINLKNKKYDFLVFTPYPDDLRQLTDQLTTAGVDLPTLAGSAWGTVDSDVMRRYVSNKKTSFYMMTSWNEKSTSGKAFVERFIKKFAKSPSADSAYGYDLGSISAQILKRISGELTKDSFMKALYKDLCFERLSIGKICFPNSGGHAKRTIYFLNYKKKGFEVFDEKRSS